MLTACASSELNVLTEPRAQASFATRSSEWVKPPSLVQHATTDVTTNTSNTVPLRATARLWRLWLRQSDLNRLNVGKARAQKRRSCARPPSFLLRHFLKSLLLQSTSTWQNHSICGSLRGYNSFVDRIDLSYWTSKRRARKHCKTIKSHIKHRKTI